MRFRHTRVRIVLVFVALHCGSLVVPARSMRAQAPRHIADGDAARAERARRPRTLRATRIEGAPPVIDGQLHDAAWDAAAVASDFVMTSPDPGALASQRTEARVLFDDRALYVGVRAFDAHPDSIIAPYPRRDDETRSDWIFVEIDSRHDRRTAFSLGVNPRGAQVDGVFVGDTDYDSSWNGVWEAVTHVDSLGWTAEYRIPFSQLAYDASRDGGPRAWGFNVYRAIARLGESSNWSPRLPTNAGVVSHFNDLVGIVPPAAPERLEVVPYTAVRRTSAPAIAGDSLQNAIAQEASAGVDVKLRATSSLMLNATVHPDFGQVEADPSQINLTTYETRFDERRAFFVEGAGRFAFDLGAPFETRGASLAVEQPFYSRRIGRSPHGTAPASARFADVPPLATLLGAAKLSGRTANGWSIGAMGALTAGASARIIDSSLARRDVQVEPRTAYGVARVVRESSGNASAIGGIATIVERSPMRDGLDEVVPQRAFALGLDARHRFGGDAYEARGFAMMSRVSGSALAIARLADEPTHLFQRPDATYLDHDSARTARSGAAAQLRLARIGGALHWSLVAHAVTPGFDVNAVGFQRAADWLLATGAVSYVRYRPGHLVRRWSMGSERIGAGWSFGGERRAAVANATASMDLRNYWGATLSVDRDLSSLSLEALRGGPALLLPPRTTVASTLHTDSRRALQLSLALGGWSEGAPRSHSLDIAPSLSWRATDRVSLSLGPDVTRTINRWQYVDGVSASGGDGARHDLVARLAQTTVSLTGRAELAFSPRMTLQLYAQPFASAGRYRDFGQVIAPRARRALDRVAIVPADRIARDPVARTVHIALGASGTPVTFADPDFHTASLIANAVFRWEYRPGSALFVVWSQQRRDDALDGSFTLDRDARRLARAPATGTLLVKASVWLPW